MPMMAHFKVHKPHNSGYNNCAGIRGVPKPPIS